jgi:hypothetical protein
MSELAHRQTDQAGSGLQAFTPDPERAMLALGLHPNNPLTHAALLLANTYGLDPLLGHVQVIPGKGSKPATIWIPRDGYLFKALQHPEWGGIDLVEEDDGGGPPDGTYFCRVVCKRKGQPDVEGRAWYKWKQGKAGGGHYIDEHADEMCLQRAERRALRRQFPLSIFPELAHLVGDDGEPTDAPDPVVEVARRVEQTSEAAGPHPAASDRDAAAAGPGYTDVASAGHEPPKAAAPTAPPPPPPDGGATPAGRRRGSGRAAAPGRDAAPTDAPPAEPTQATFDRADPHGVGPVPTWCLQHQVSQGTARLYLSRQHAEDFGHDGKVPLRTVNDLMALQGEDAARATAYLAAQFTDTGEPKDWGGAGDG